MKLTRPQIDCIFRGVEGFLQEAERWIKKNVNRRAVRIRYEGGKFTFECNVSCSCHPEYEERRLTDEQSSALFSELADLSMFGANTEEEKLEIKMWDEE